MKMSEGLEGHSTVTLLTLGSCLGLTRTHLQKKVCSNLYIYTRYSKHIPTNYEKNAILDVV